jgi:predicted DNA-binding transcriptional regulator AlpA
MPNQSSDLLGLQEAAAYLGLHKEQIRRLRALGTFPEPLAVLSMGPVWTLEQIRAYKRKGK